MEPLLAEPLVEAPEQGEPRVDPKKYLARFGYLAPADSDPTDRLARVRDIGLPVSDLSTTKLDEQAVTALKTFQQFYNLKPTGTLTDETRRLMLSPRCGMPDRPKLFDPQTGLIANFVVQGNRWGRTNLTYAFQNFTGDLGTADIINAIRQAFLAWSNFCFLTFTEVSGAGDIRIQFTAGDHGDGAPFDGPGGVLAHGFYPPPNGGDLAGDLHFDDAEIWSLTVPTPAARFDLWTVALHEVGHTLGLDHSNNAGAVMYAFYSGLRRNLQPDDTSGIASIYGGRSAKATLSDTAIGQPAWAALNQRGFLAWTGTNAAHNLNVMQTAELRVWVDKVTLGETSLSGPSLTVFNGRLYLAWRGVGNNKLNVMSSGDGRTWTNKVTLGDTTFNSPALCSANGKLFLAWTGTDNSRKLNIMQSGNGTNWGGKLTLGDTSVDGPSLCSLGNRVLLAWAGTNAAHNLNVMSYDGGSSFSNKVTLGESSFLTPNLTTVNGTVILAWTGTDSANKLNTLRSTNGVNFSLKATLNETSFFAPNVGSFNGRSLLLWTGKDNARSLNVMTI
ncbi:matrixin family metalloprotease [Hymenobacter bucti]|uniref:Matrixin family metalloprotease n=1 Tax=Hymenobacter bucti TaxID=1844114 RepID=A0ABW4QZG0_9BACT